jgi:hypothetical protein
MKTLKLKSKYKGLRVTRSDIRVGKITFDANSVSPEHYQNYYDLGFTELFEIEEDAAPKKEIIVEEEKSKKKRPKRKKRSDNNDLNDGDV